MSRPPIGTLIPIGGLEEFYGDGSDGAFNPESILYSAVAPNGGNPIDLFDRNTTTAFITNTLSAAADHVILSIDFGTPQLVTELRYFNRSISTGASRQLEAQYSHDGLTWTVGGTHPFPTTVTNGSSNGLNLIARYWRLVLKAGGSDCTVRIRNITINGTLTEETTLTWRVLYPVTIHSGLIVKQFTSLTVPAGYEITTNNPCRGLVIYCQGNVDIFGNIDMSKKAGIAPNGESIPMIIAKKYVSGQKWVSDGITRNTVTNQTVVANAYDTSGNGGRNLVRLSNGWIVCAVHKGDYIYFYKSTNNGVTFSQICYTSYDVNPSLPGGFAIAAKGTTVYLMVGGAATRISFLKFDAVTIGNINVSEAIQIDINQTAIGSGVSLAVADNGTLHAVWSSKNSSYPNSFNIRTAKSTDGGITWTKHDGTAGVDQISTNNSGPDQAKNPSVVAYGTSRVMIVYDQQQTGNSVIRQARFDGSTWAYAPLIYSLVTAPNLQTNPCVIATPSGRLWCFWAGQGSYGSNMNVKAMYSDNNGATWLNGGKTDELLSTGTYDQGSPSATCDKAGNVWVEWAGRSAESTVYSQLRRIKHNGVTWGNIDNLTSNTSASIVSPSLLYDLTIDVTDPLVIYKDAQTSTVKFRGDWEAETGHYEDIISEITQFTLTSAFPVLKGGNGGNGGPGGVYTKNESSRTLGGTGGRGRINQGGFGGGGGGGSLAKGGDGGNIDYAEIGGGYVPRYSMSGGTSGFISIHGFNGSGGLGYMALSNGSQITVGAGGRCNGGGGGGSGSVSFATSTDQSGDGGNGQYAGGFLCMIVGGSLQIQQNGSLKSNGGSGGEGGYASSHSQQSGGGGGGGSGGGVVAVFHKGSISNSGTIEVSGGAGGVGGFGQPSGENGFAGTSGSVGTIHIQKI